MVIFTASRSQKKFGMILAIILTIEIFFICYIVGYEHHSAEIMARLRKESERRMITPLPPD